MRSLSDIDECLVLNGGCEDFCNNTDGSFTCLCPNISGTEPNGLQCIGESGFIQNFYLAGGRRE